MKLKDVKKSNLPASPGVYFFLKGKDILYIGKATSLRDRVKSYFSKDLIETRGPHIVDMVFKSNTVRFQETDSVLEALIFEAKLIKQYKPYYNTKEKDDKSFNYVVITKDDFPKVLIERGKNINFKNSEVLGVPVDEIYGPFISGILLREALKIIRRIFPFIDKSSMQKDKYEFYRQLGLTPDMNSSEISLHYRKTITSIKLFFEGKKSKIISNLKKDMMGYAKAQQFEEAEKIKRTIFALEHIHDVSLIKEENLEEGTNKKFRIEAYDIAHMSGKQMVGVMTVLVNGIPEKSDYRKFIIRTQTHANDIGALEEVLSRRFRHTEWGLPELVVVDGGVAQKNVAERVLKRYQLSIPVVSVVKNDRHKPEKFLGEEALIKSHESAILLSNAEAHRFAIRFHKEKRSKNFLNPALS